MERFHALLLIYRGRAQNHNCDCGAEADGWALIGEPADIWGGYTPRCRSCHQRIKREAITRNRPKDQVFRRSNAPVGKQRDQCLECGMVTAPGPMGAHQRATNHYGRVEL